MKEKDPFADKNVLDVSKLAPSLSYEYVSQGQLEGMYTAAEQILKTDGVESAIEGVPYTVSKDSLKSSDGHRNYYSRIYRNQSGDRVGLVVCETNTLPVHTPNPNALYIYKGVGGYRLQGDLAADPTVDDPEQAEILHTALARLSDMQHKNEQEHQRELEQARYTRKRHREQNIKDAAQAGAVIALGLSVLGGVVTGGYFGVEAIANHKSSNEKFAAGHYQLTGGVAIALGQTASPAFSADLFNRASTVMSVNQVPNAADPSQEDHDNDYHDGALKADGQLREVTLVSSKTQGGKNCTNFDIPKAPVGSELIAWTDAIDKYGKHRDSQLQITYTLGKSKACWVGGQEQSIDDDPRVVFELATTPQEIARATAK